MNDKFGDRMKNSYEYVTHYKLPRRTHTVIRLDGKAFHRYTRTLKRPFDEDLHSDIVEATRLLCADVQGCKLAYVQSDEVSLVLTDFDSVHTEAWFGGVVQKISSVAAGCLSSYFNAARSRRTDLPSDTRILLGIFDARVFTIPELTEVLNYLIWRQGDATRNSILNTGVHHLSHKQIMFKSGTQIQELLWSQKQINWNDCDDRFKRGTLIYPQMTIEDVEYVDKRSGETKTVSNVTRRRWIDVPAPKFTQCRGELRGWIVPLPTLTARRDQAIADFKETSGDS